MLQIFVPKQTRLPNISLNKVIRSEVIGRGLRAVHDCKQRTHAYTQAYSWRSRSCGEVSLSLSLFSLSFIDTTEKNVLTS